MTRKQAVEQETFIKRRKKKLNVEPGKSISSEDIEKLVLPSTSKTAVCSNKKKVSRKAKAVKNSSEEDERDRYSSASESSLKLSDIKKSFDVTSDHENLNDGYLPAREEFVIVNYEGEYWPGQVVKVEANGAYIKCMARSGKLWKWPDKEDCLFYPKNDIKLSICKPKQKSTKRELFHVPELDDVWDKPKK